METMEKGMEYITDPSFGIIRVSKRVGISQHLFGSNVPQDTILILSIHQAEMGRSTNKTYITDRGRAHIEVGLTPLQLGSLWMNSNSGDGTPCTILQRDGTPYKMPKIPSEGMMFRQEVKQHVETLKAFTDKITATVESNNMTKKAADEIKGEIKKFKMQLEENMPFILDQMSLTMDKIVSEAQNKIDFAVQEACFKRGLKDIKSVNLIEDEHE